MAKKSFNEKLRDSKNMPEIVEIKDPAQMERWGRTLLIAPPIEYEGIMRRVPAHASDERGFDETPYWRTLKKDGELNEKYPGGIDKQAERLASEGVKVIKKGKRTFVENYADILYNL